MNFLDDIGRKLIDNGYKIIPISKGLKYPKGLKDWQNIKATHADVDQWISDGYEGIGILCESTPAVDIDIQNEKLAVEMWNEVKRIAGEGPLRVGKHPKCLLPFKTLAPFPKMASKKYIDPGENDDSKTYQVEILGAGNQFVAEGIHPDTGNPYKWKEEPGNLSAVPRGELPSLDQYKAQEIIDAFEHMIPSNWIEWKDRNKEQSNASDSGAEESNPKRDLPSSDTFANMKSKWGGSAVEVKKILDDIDPTDYKMWVDAGFCVWHETDGSEEGFQLWDEWSKGAPEEYKKETDKERRTKWKTFDWKPNAEQGVKYVTFKSLVFHAHGGALSDTKEVAGFLNQYFYVEAGKKVFNSQMQDNMEYAFLDLDEFHEARKNVIISQPIACPTEKDPLKMKDKDFFVSQEWQKHENRKTCKFLVYEPRQGVIHHVKDNDYQINTCHMPSFPLIDDSTHPGVLDVFFEHMELLFPDPKERHWFVSWLARKIQMPWDKCAVTPLLVAPEEGVGRSWLGYLIFELLGGGNCKRVEIKSLSAGNSFNSYMNDSLMCVIDEVFQKGSSQADGKYTISANLKSKISEKTAEINIKYETTRIKTVYTDFLLMTNERDALSFSDSNRRIAVFIYEGMPREPAYYERLYGWVNDKSRVGVSALWWYLKGYDISGVDFQRAPDTQAKKDMIEESKSALEYAVDDMLVDPPFWAMTVAKMLDYFRDNAEQFEGLDPFKLKSDVALLQILKHHRSVSRYRGVSGRTQIRVGKSFYRPWILDGRLSVDADDLKNELEKQKL